MRTLALLLLMACGGGVVLPDLNPEPGHNVRRVLGAGALLAPDWRASHWARTSDSPEGAMVYFVVAVDGSACIVPSQLWVMVREGDAVRCQGKWRMPR